MKDQRRQDTGGRKRERWSSRVPFETNRGLRSDDLAGDLPEGTSAYEGYLNEVTVLTYCKGLQCIVYLFMQTSHCTFILQAELSLA